MLFCEARVHSEYLSREQGGLIAAGAGADLDDDVLLVVGILRQKKNLQILLDHRRALFQLQKLFLCHGAQSRIGLLASRVLSQRQPQDRGAVARSFDISAGRRLFPGRPVADPAIHSGLRSVPDVQTWSLSPGPIPRMLQNLGWE